MFMNVAMVEFYFVYTTAYLRQCVDHNNSKLVVGGCSDSFRVFRYPLIIFKILSPIECSVNEW